ncbi:MAG: hypothetical protein KatS3mg049_4123 [Caldilinea sp.]|uniref:CARDB domain-containing protein n=2 Tax=Caldilineaceae TaxID=475964 RepID=I0HZ14_CALAS|nr:hypothetical protein CLDAP_02120 [Caldilinea aerophila DSM 14535 = NBRC 104270]GIV75567.1 MAG: hypothetical protein KatS3mg049_4123 [Caldilinea sp.]
MPSKYRRGVCCIRGPAYLLGLILCFAVVPFSSAQMLGFSTELLTLPSAETGNSSTAGWATHLPLVSTAGSTGLAPLCRFGVNAISTDTGIDLSQLRIGWYQNYTTALHPSRPNGAEFAQTIRLSQTGPTSYRYRPGRAEIIQIANTNPGSMWLIGNEPDRRYYQDDIEPHVYAAVYHELYNLIKQADPTAIILAGSIVQATEIRIRYLNMVLNSYRQAYGHPMPVDAWSIHGFILNEVSCDKNPDPDHLGCSGADIPPGIDDAVGLVLDPIDTPPHDWVDRNDDFEIFVENIVRFRKWMAQNGYRDTPLFLSEYGVLIPSTLYRQFTPDRVNSFMNRTFDYLLTAADPMIGLPSDGNRLVQRLSWYSTTDQQYNGYLFTREGQLSPMGENYRAYTAKIQGYTDFSVTSIRTDPPMLLAESGPVTVTLQVTIGNSGNLLNPSRGVARIFNGNPQNNGIQIGSDRPVALAGCGQTQSIEVVWENVEPDNYELYVVIEPEAGTQDTDNTNNISSIQLFPVTSQTWLPTVHR